jgi:hypothetical protein
MIEKPTSKMMMRDVRTPAIGHLPHLRRMMAIRKGAIALHRLPQTKNPATPTRRRNNYHMINGGDA